MTLALYHAVASQKELKALWVLRTKAPPARGSIPKGIERRAMLERIVEKVESCSIPKGIERLDAIKVNVGWKDPVASQKELKGSPW